MMIPKGYKNTTVGIIPEEWEVKKVEDVFNFFPTASFSRANEIEDGKTQHLHYGDIHTKFDFQLEITDENLPRIESSSAERFEKIKIGDVVLADASEDYEGVGKTVEIMNVANLPVIAGLHTFHLRENEPELALGYKGYLFSGEIIKRQFYRIAVGTKVYSLSKVALQNVHLPIPPFAEQEKIATILSTWDKAIEQYQALLEQYEQRKKWLMQNLLTGKKRLEGFEGEWKEYRFNEAFKRITGKKHQISSKAYLSSGRYPVIDQGKEKIVAYSNNEESFTNIPIIVFGDHTRIIKYIDFPFIIGADGTQLLKNKNTNFNLNFLYYMLDYTPIINLGYSRHMRVLITKKFKIPLIEEQTAIANILKIADKEIDLIKDKIEKLQEQKKGLMQQLLSGRKRVVENN